MSYQVLARKWRPKNFDQLVGQELTARALINALDSQRLHHAFLFTGTRGVGKTTIARIFSKSLNCEQGLSSKPCGTCSSCVEIDEGRFVDLMEIDAASKTGIDDMRELIDNVQYKPTRGRYKVYLIDEVHMLSTHSFNALLKTLEEPPSHVIFLLATTDPQKLPITVLSRCLQFHLRRMELESIVSHLSMILEQEKIGFQRESLEAIAKGADGSMRDALSLLDQAIVFSGEELNLASVLEMLGSIEQHFVYDLLDKMIAGDAQGLIDVIQNMAQFSPDYIEVMNDWLSMLHQIAVAKAIGYTNDIQIKQAIDKISAVDLQLFYQLSLQAKKDLPFAPNLRQGFEMAMLRVLSFKPNFYNAPSTDSKKKSNSPLNSKNELNNPAESPTQPVNSNHSKLQVVATETVRSGQGEPYLQQNTSNNINQLPQTGQTLGAARSPTVEAANPASQTNSVSQADQTSATVQTLPVINQALAEVIEMPLSPVAGRTSSQQKQVSEPNQTQALVDKIPLLKINIQNWPQAIKQFSLLGTGLQVLRNSLPEVEQGRLTIRYAETMSHLLTHNLKQKIEQTIYTHFSSETFTLVFKASSDLQSTPKEQQLIETQASIEQIQQQMLDNQCIQFILSETGAKITQDNISLKPKHQD
ncbi:MAG: DNA polymerase III subunit gamma/tau [Enterobacterales bacterium]|nr:DNA polymerase III subunit gamma/tau [Enterobacterales bacterium]